MLSVVSTEASLDCRSGLPPVWAAPLETTDRAQKG